MPFVNCYYFLNLDQIEHVYMFLLIFSVRINPDDPRWVGAWWIGFVIASILFVLAAVPISLFGAELPSKYFPLLYQRLVFEWQSARMVYALDLSGASRCVHEQDTLNLCLVHSGTNSRFDIFTIVENLVIRGGICGHTRKVVL
jgi:hypothetical protein